MCDARSGGICSSWCVRFPRRKCVARAELAVPWALVLMALMPTVPALLLGWRNDVPAWNPLGHALVAGQHRDDRALADLVGDLSLHRREFTHLWTKHDVRLCSSGTKRLHHPQVGGLDLRHEVLHLDSSPGILCKASVPSDQFVETRMDPTFVRLAHVKGITIRA